MTEIKEIYKCNICGNIVEVLHAGPGELVCCGEPMKKQEPKTEDASTEKHVPYIEKTDKGILVKVGQNQDHPMEEKHYIEWIEIIFKSGKAIKKMLNFEDDPKAEFCRDGKVKKVRIYCNIHGLWKAE